MNKLADECNNTYHHYIDKKPIDGDFCAFSEEFESIHKALKFKVGNKFMITKYKNIFSKCYSKNWSRLIYLIDSVLKTSPWMYKIKDLNREKVIRNFREKEILLYKL